MFGIGKTGNGSIRKSIIGVAIADNSGLIAVKICRHSVSTRDLDLLKQLISFLCQA